MLTTKQACKMAEALEGVTVKDHFGSDAYCANGRIFVTIWHEQNEANLRLSLEEQRRFLSLDGEGFAEIDNAWGRQGFTKAQLAFVDPKDFAEALRSAWQHSARKGSALSGGNPQSNSKSKSKSKSESKKPTQKAIQPKVRKKTQTKSQTRSRVKSKTASMKRPAKKS